MKKKSTLAVTGFVLSILAVFMTPLLPIALMIDILAYRRVKKSPETYGGRRLAIAGLCLCQLSVIAFFVLMGMLHALPRQALKQLQKTQEIARVQIEAAQ